MVKNGLSIVYPKIISFRFPEGIDQNLYLYWDKTIKDNGAFEMVFYSAMDLLFKEVGSDFGFICMTIKKKVIDSASVVTFHKADDYNSSILGYTLIPVRIEILEILKRKSYIDNFEVIVASTSLFRKMKKLVGEFLDLLTQDGIYTN